MHTKNHNIHSIFFVLIFGLCILVTEKATGNEMLKVENLRTEYKHNPISIDVVQPRLSWEILSDKHNTRQVEFEIRFAVSKENLSDYTRFLWSKRVKSDRSVHVVYDGPALTSRQRVWWQVRVWDNHGRESAWSEPGYWELGLLDEKDWKADWIGAEIQEDVKISQPAQYFRREFKLRKNIKSARLYVTSHGLYEALINDKRIGNDVFTPGWTSYSKRIQYQTYDVTDRVQKGQNTIGVILGDGWYRGYLGWVDRKNVYGEKLALLAQLEVLYEDGSKEIIVSDKKWKASNDGPIRLSDIYNGETYDAQKEWPGWSASGFDDSNWHKVTVKPFPKDNLVASYGPPVRKIEAIKPFRIIPKENDTYIFDMGQNMVGWLRLKVNGTAGTKIQLRHTEFLDKEGNFYTENLRSAKQTVTYTCNGVGEEVYEPHFTFQGFRFVEMSGYPGKPDLESITGVVIHSDMTPTGTFVCSDSLINLLQHNIRWGLKGNFLDVPTDCPQRDERLGWTGDAQVFAPTACFLMDAATFYTKWLKDLALDQGEDGVSRDVIPDVLKGGGGHTGWADASVVVPWTVYLNYGDVRILENQYESMKAWIGYMTKKAGDDFIWDGDWHYGDWLSFDDDSPAYMGAYTETDLIATAYFAWSTILLSKAAEIIGKTEEARGFRGLAEKIKSAFRNEFVTSNGRLVSHTQTAYTLALAFDLLPEIERHKAAEYLYHNVNRFKHITTGFLGTPLICRTLTDHGYLDMAYLLLNRKEYPSWLYPVTMGATTIWERWDGLKPDSTFQNAGMNSFNHYAYGAIGKWLYSTVAGLDIDEQNPGYKNIIINPHPGGGLTGAKAEIHTMYGKACSEWAIRDGQMIMNVTVPVNTTAEVHFPVKDITEISEHGIPIQGNPEIIVVTQLEGRPVVKVGSGDYHFSIPMPVPEVDE